MTKDVALRCEWRARIKFNIIFFTLQWSKEKRNPTVFKKLHVSQQQQQNCPELLAKCLRCEWSVAVSRCICTAAVTGKRAYIDTATGAIQGNESLNTHENTELYSHSRGVYSQVTQFLTGTKS